MVNVELHDLRLECQLCGTITVIGIAEQARIAAKLKKQGLAARCEIVCNGDCGGKSTWSLGIGALHEAN